MDLKISTIITAIVMFIALVGMISCAKKQRTYPRAQHFAIVLMIIIIGCGIAILYQTDTIGPGETQRLIENELKFSKAKAYIFGRDISKKFPGERTLIIANYNYGKSQRQQDIIESLKKGLGTETQVTVDTPELSDKFKGPNGEMDIMPIQEMMKASDFDAIIDRHPNAKVIVSLIGLPTDAAKMAIWNRPAEERPAIALMDSDIYNLKDAIKSGLISMVTSYRPGVKFTEDPCPEDPQEAFDARYIIITPENIDKICSEYPKLFP